MTEQSDEELHTRALTAIQAAMEQRWPDSPIPDLLATAESLLDTALELGPGGAVVLSPGSHPDCYRLAHAVRSTGPVIYDGPPTQQDLTAAEAVIKFLVNHRLGQ